MMFTLAFHMPEKAQRKNIYSIRLKGGELSGNLLNAVNCALSPSPFVAAIFGNKSIAGKAQGIGAIAWWGTCLCLLTVFSSALTSAGISFPSLSIAFIWPAR